MSKDQICYNFKWLVLYVRLYSYYFFFWELFHGITNLRIV